MSDEQISMEYMNRMIEWIQDKLDEHYKHCPYCIPKKWVCPDANQLQISLADWQRRRDEGSKPKEKQS